MVKPIIAPPPYITHRWMVLNHPQVVYITIKPATLTSDTKKNHEGHEGQVTDSIGCQTFFSRCLRGRVPLFSVETHGCIGSKPKFRLIYIDDQNISRSKWLIHIHLLHPHLIRFFPFGKKTCGIPRQGQVATINGSASMRPSRHRAARGNAQGGRIWKIHLVVDHFLGNHGAFHIFL